MQGDKMKQLKKTEHTYPPLSIDEKLAYHIVNLKHDIERLTYQKKQAIRHNLKLHVHEACTPQAKELEKYRAYWCHTPPVGEDAICISFKKLFDEAQNQSQQSDANNHYLIIAEDDTVLCRLFRKQLDLTLNSLPQDWDILYLGSNGAKQVPSSGQRFFNQWPTYPEHGWIPHAKVVPGGPVCFLIKRNALKTLAKHYTHQLEKKWTGFDSMMLDSHQTMHAHLADAPQLAKHTRKFSSSKEKWTRDVLNIIPESPCIRKIKRWRNKSTLKKNIANILIYLFKIRLD